MQRTRRRAQALLATALVAALACAAWQAPAALAQPAAPEPVSVTDAPASDTSPTGKAGRGAAPWHRTKLSVMGFTEALQRYGTADRVDMGFTTRRDRVLVTARLDLDLDPGVRLPPDIEALVVEVNSEQVAKVPRARFSRDGGRLQLPIDHRLVGDRNLLTLRLERPGDGACKPPLPPGTWALVRRGTLLRRSERLPLASELSRYPLPFIDPDFDREPRVHVSLLGGATPEVVKAAMIFAGGLGLEVGSKVRYRVDVGRQPSATGVVFALGEDAAKRLGLPAVTRPTLRMIDAPGQTPGRDKLLVLQAAKAAGLVRLADALARRQLTLQGAVVTLPERALPEGRKVARRWLPTDRVARFGDLTGGEDLRFTGRAGGTLRLSFRIPPDLMVWPREDVPLRLQLRRTVPPGTRAPDLHVEFNGHFVRRLRPGKIGANGWEDYALTVHRTHLRGYNELAIHVDFTGVTLACQETLEPGEEPPQVEVSVSADSTLDLSGHPRLISLPDLSRFIYDAFPFARRPDLGQTLVVIPDAPQGAGIAAALSVASHAAAVTGQVGSQVQVALASAVVRSGPMPKDLLVVGTWARNRALTAWRDHLPLRLSEHGIGPRNLSWLESGLALLEGRLPWLEADRARAFVGGARRVGAVLGAPSPLSREHTLIAITGTQPGDLPAVADMQGFAASRFAASDLLLVSGDHRAQMRIGPQISVGSGRGWIRFRWFLARHWLVVLLAAVAASLVFTWAARRLVARAARQRLGVEAA